MAALIAKRIAVGAFLVLVVLTITFLAIRAVPGDPAMLLLGGETGTTSAAQLANMRAALGLDQPLHVQYLNFVGGFLSGDLGQSFRNDTPVMELVLRRLPNSLELIALSSILAVAIGIAMGSWAARRGGAADTFVAAVTSLGVATPGFVLGAALVTVFALQLRWLPAGGLRPVEQSGRPHFRNDPARDRAVARLPRGRCPHDPLVGRRDDGAGLGADRARDRPVRAGKSIAGMCCATR